MDKITDPKSLSNAFRKRSQDKAANKPEEVTSNKVTDSNQMFIESRKLKGSVSYDWSKTDVSMANYTNGYLTKK